MSPQQRFESSDIYLSAYLLSQGATLEGVRRGADNKVTFLLQRESAFSDLLTAYWSNEPVSVVPAQLYASLKFLKSLLYSNR